MDDYISNRFKRGGVRLYHAENLLGFRTYLEAGALLSREILSQRLGDQLVPFDSDASDAELGALGRVFGNLQDFGYIFSSRRQTVPNVYGPISMRFQPGIFALLNDIRITKTSIMSLQGDWHQSAMLTAEEIESMFEPEEFYQLKREFSTSEVSSANAQVGLERLEQIRVEPLEIRGRPLVDIVREMCGSHGVEVEIVERHFYDNRRAALAALQQAVNEMDSVAAVTPEVLGKLASELSLDGDQKIRQLERWARYFFRGTLAVG